MWLWFCTANPSVMASLPLDSSRALAPLPEPRQDDDESGPRPRRGLEQAQPSSTDPSRWHARRHHAILREHPEVRRLFGIDRASAVWVGALVVAQLGIAAGVHRSPWWLLLIEVMLVGAPIAHALGVLIHECSHNLVFRSTAANKALAIVANLPLGAPAAIEFRHQHLLHHRHLGDTREPNGGDTQAPVRREVRATGRSSWRKILSFTFGRFVFGGRDANRTKRDAWLVANAVTSLATSLALVLAFGPRALAYVVLSSLFAFGPHPLGARRLAEHFTLRPGQPTLSYYGPGNLISFDVGYHVEHHDFPFVPWSRLAVLRAKAREHYEPLATVRSWTGLLLAHFFDRRRHVGQYVGLSEDYVEAETAAPLEGDRPRP
jgi:sphingolipid delta-4 desaturase